ncbi:glycosyltransferase family 25 protein [Oceanisphaera sp. KMM 10153]|uniref:glycosyltransferase family 25 protein n=1 Tax=Oceanisphaera submarina TaxID=3390193 RepID=UPI003976DBA0
MHPLSVFVISLEKCLERRDYIAAQLQQQGIDFSFFNAVNGSDKSNPLLKRYNHTKRKWLTSGKEATDGEIGCYASHYSLWQKCADINQPLVVVEDDAKICPNAAQTLKLAAEKIEKYGFLRLECVIRGETITMEESEDYRISRMSDNFGGLRAYAIAPWAAQKLLRGSQSWSLPVDNYIGAPYFHGMESYHLHPDFAEDTRPFETTIQFYDKEQVPFYRKPSRELYSAYRKLRLYLHNRKFKKIKCVG